MTPLEAAGHHALFQGVQGWAVLAGLLLLRTTGLVLTAPLPGDMIPMQIRGAIALIIAFALTPLASPSLGAAGALSGAAFVAAAAGEILIGILFGFVLRMSLAAVDAAGQLVGMQMGIGFGGIIDPMMGQEVTPTGRLLAATAMLAFVSAGGLQAMIGALADSVIVAPPGSFGVSALIQASGPEILGGLVRLLPTALSLAAPVLGVLLVANVSLAVLTRASPGLNIFSISFIVSIVAGLYALRSAEPAILIHARALAEGLRDRLFDISAGVHRGG